MKIFYRRMSEALAGRVRGGRNEAQQKAAAGEEGGLPPVAAAP